MVLFSLCICIITYKHVYTYFQIHWYRNGEFLNYTMLSENERLRENKKHFSLEIKRVEVGDQVINDGFNIFFLTC